MELSFRAEATEGLVSLILSEDKKGLLQLWIQTLGLSQCKKLSLEAMNPEYLSGFYYYY